MNVIETNGLGKRYGGAWALRECTLAIPDGCVAALVGPNGAGKSTLTVVADTSPGVHDTLMASCDAERYRQLGFQGRHDSCHDNFEAALRDIGIAPPPLPSPLNLFMNVPWSPDGSLRYEPPASRPADLVRFRAETDLVVIMSACPQDLTPVNGAAQRPVDAHFQVHRPGADGDG